MFHLLADIIQGLQNAARSKRIKLFRPDSYSLHTLTSETWSLQPLSTVDCRSSAARSILPSFPVEYRKMNAAFIISCCRSEALAVKRRICGSYLHHHRKEHKPSALNGLAAVDLADYDKMVIKTSENITNNIITTYEHSEVHTFHVNRCFIFHSFLYKRRKSTCPGRGA